MSDWKGEKVIVSVEIETLSGVWEVHHGEYYLDTDTMADLFDQYDPKVHRYTITPAVVTLE